MSEHRSLAATAGLVLLAGGSVPFPAQAGEASAIPSGSADADGAITLLIQPL
jgi:hypothetical protein